MQSINVAGHERFLGYIPSSKEKIDAAMLAGHLVRWEEHVEFRRMMKPRADWIEYDCSHFVQRIHDQDGIGQCVAEAATGSAEITYAKMGITGVALSPAYLYAAINGGSDNGSMPVDALEITSTVGLLPSGYGGVDDLGWKAAAKTSYWTKPTSAVAVEAKKMMVTEAIFCGEDVEAFFAGLQSGMWAGVFCLGVGNNFDTNADGWLPKCDGAQMNHALCTPGGMGINPSTKKWGLLNAVNSWGESWGKAGLFSVDETWLKRQYQECYLVREMTRFQ